MSEKKFFSIFMPVSSGGIRYRKAFISGGIGIVAQVISLLIGMITLRYWYNYLNTEEYGLWMSLLSAASLLSVLDLGLGNILINVVGNSLGRNNGDAASKYISNAIAILAFISFLAITIILLLSENLEGHILASVASKSASRSSFYQVFYLILLGALLSLGQTIVEKIQSALQLGYRNSICSTCGAIITLILTILAIDFHCNIEALVLTAILGSLIALLSNGIWLFCFTRPVLYFSLSLVSLKDALQLLKASHHFLLLQICAILSFSLDAFVVSSLLSFSDAGTFYIVSRLYNLPLTFIMVAISPLWPAYTEALAISDHKWVHQTLKLSLGTSTFIAIVLATFLLIFSQIIISLWLGSNSFSLPYTYYLPFAIWLVLSSIGNCLTLYLHASGQLGIQIICGIAMTVLSLVLKFYAIPVFGAPGVMWATIFSYILVILLPQGIMTISKQKNLLNSLRS